MTGSIPSELLNTNYTDFDAYGNQLSNLTSVEGEVICSVEDGEHYCNCDIDCTFYPNRCACEEAQACCATYIEQFTECILCENGLENPDFYIEEFGLLCFDANEYVKSSLSEYGTDAGCKEARTLGAAIGCICKGVSPDLVEPAEGLLGI